MQNLDWLSDALGEFEDDYVRFNPLSLSLSLSFALLPKLPFSNAEHS